jgi:uncharacterized membrane protein YoaK (UPF0700 family)
VLVHQGSERDHLADRRLACSLAGVAGALNTAAFYEVGFFSANMTGNLSTLSDHIAANRLSSGLIYLGIIALFILGASVSTIMVNIGHRRGIGGIFALVILTEAAGMVPLGCADLWFGRIWRTPTLVLGLSFLMGLQNAVVTRISDARVRTTHISGIATDIGIELGLMLDGIRGTEPRDRLVPIGRRLRLHVETFLSFLVGGVGGVMLYKLIGGYLFWTAAVVLAMIALYGLWQARHAEKAPNSDTISNDL